MKKLHSISLLFLSALAFTACVNEEDDLFSESAAARLNAAESRYTDILTASPGGWTMEYYPTQDTLGFKGKGYLLLANFKKDGTVRVGMWNAFSGNSYKEDTSLWDIITDNGPVLSFNTYNECLHAFCDPHDLPASIQGVSADDKEDVTGLGAEGDYEFVLTDVKADVDVITVKGKKRGSYVRMCKMPEDFENYETYFLALKSGEVLLFPSDAVNKTYLTVGGRRYVMSDFSTGIISLYPEDGDPITDTKYYAFVFTHYNDKFHLRFRKPIVNEEASVQEFEWDADQAFFVDADGSDATLKGPDPTDFFLSWPTTAVSYNWQLNSSESGMSTSFRSVYTALETELKNSASKYTITQLSFKKAEDALKLQIDLSYKRTNRSYTASLEFGFNAVKTESGLALSYTSPLNQAAENMFASISSFPAFLNMLSDTYQVRGKYNSFVLNDTRLRSVNDSEKWFYVSAKTK